MWSKNLFGSFLLLVGGSAAAVEFPVEITEYFDDVKVDCYVRESDITAQSEWLPVDDNPPLAIRDALHAVRQYIGENDHLDDALVTGIELKPIPHYDHYWHYLVKATSSADRKSAPHFYVVLMNGKVISAFQEPDAVK